MFYDNLKNACSRENTTVTTLLKKLNLNTGNTGSWKKGGYPSVKVLLVLAESLNVSIDYLLTGKESEKESLDSVSQSVVNDFQSLDSEGKASVLRAIMSAKAQMEEREKNRAIKEALDEYYGSGQMIAAGGKTHTIPKMDEKQKEELNKLLYQYKSPDK